jgi:hypothetical protein
LQYYPKYIENEIDLAEEKFRDKHLTALVENNILEAEGVKIDESWGETVKSTSVHCNRNGKRSLFD